MKVLMTVIILCFPLADVNAAENDLLGTYITQKTSRMSSFIEEEYMTIADEKYIYFTQEDLFQRPPGPQYKYGFAMKRFSTYHSEIIDNQQHLFLNMSEDQQLIYVRNNDSLLLIGMNKRVEVPESYNKYIKISADFTYNNELEGVWTYKTQRQYGRKQKTIIEFKGNKVSMSTSYPSSEHRYDAKFSVKKIKGGLFITAAQRNSKINFWNKIKVLNKNEIEFFGDIIPAFAGPIVHNYGTESIKLYRLNPK